MKKLTKSSQNKKVSGVLGGIANYFDIDPTVVRVIFIIAFFPTFPWSIIAYFILAIVMPDDTEL